MIAAQGVMAAGGCGAAYLPMNALSPDKNLLQGQQYQIGLTLQRAKFDQFKEGDKDLTNPGGNEAVITQSTLFVNYGIAEKVTASLLIPYLRKKQQTNKFGTRIAEGIGDISLFGRYEFLSPLLNQGPLATVGLGVKFPTGSISEPGSTNRLPPAFQVGSGTYDLVPTSSYNQRFNHYDISVNLSIKIPMEENRRGYKFGKEYRVNVSVSRPLNKLADGMSASLGLGYLNAEKDTDSNMILPGKLRDGTTVLNTGGQFLDVVPGVTFALNKSLRLQASVLIPVYENWNGKRSANVGQVAPEITSQLSLVYTGSL
jgi:hypothetical protein